MVNKGPWRAMTLGDVCAEGGGSIQTGPFGSQLHASDYVKDGIPSVMPQNIGDNTISDDGIARITPEDAGRLSKYLVRAGDIVYSRRGDIEKRALVRRENEGWLCGTGCLRVRLGGDSTHDARFVSYQLGTEEVRSWLVRHAVGATMPNLNTSILSAVPLRMPGIDAQRAIAEVLGALEDRIAADFREEALADEFINATYGRLEREHGGKTVPLLESFSVDFGEPFSGELFSGSGNGRPLIRIRDLKTFRPQVWTLESRQREVTVEPGEVVVGMDAEFTPTVWLGRPGLLNQRVCRVRGTDVGSAFIREAIREPLARIESSKTGTTVIHLNKRDLENATVIKPNEDGLASFEAVAEPVLARRVALAAERRALVVMRDALLPALMSGELRVRDAERLAEEVA